MATNEIPKNVIAALNKCWSDGVIEEFDSSESYFHSIQQTLEHDLRKIPGASVLWQTEKLENDAAWDDDDPPPDAGDWCSYHLYFLAPQGSEFRFEDETEGLEYDEETGEEISPAEMCPGEGWIGCAVGICLAARVAAVSPASYSRFEDGSESYPDISDTAQHDHETLTDPMLDKLEQLSGKIVAVLKKHRIQFLEPAILELPVPDLTASSEVFLQPPLHVRDAFFFRGV